MKLCPFHLCAILTFGKTTLKYLELAYNALIILHDPLISSIIMVLFAMRLQGVNSNRS